MGLIRILLISSIILFHSIPIFGLTLVGGNVALRAFFIISGFSIAFVLNEKYKQQKNSIKNFYINRLFKIFPAYWLVLMLNFPWYNAELEYLTKLKIGIFTIFHIIIANIFLFGADLVWLIDIDPVNQSISYISSFIPKPNIQGIIFLVIPHSWALGLILLFYLISPLLVKLKSYYLIGILTLSMLVQWLAQEQEFTHALWSKRNFYFIVIYFIIGILSYRMYTRIDKIKLNNKFFYGANLVIILYILFYSVIPISEEIKSVTMYSLLFLLLPFIAKFTKNVKFNIFLGSVAYVMYISHYFVDGLIYYSYQFLSLSNDSSIFRGLWLVIFTFIFSVILTYIFVNPIKKFGQRYVGD